MSDKPNNNDPRNDKVTVIDRRRTGITEARDAEPILTPTQVQQKQQEEMEKFNALLASLTPRQQRMVMLNRCGEITAAMIQLAQAPPPVTGDKKRPTQVDVLFRILMNQHAMLEALWHLHADLLPGDEDFQQRQQAKRDAAAEDTGNGI